MKSRLRLILKELGIANLYAIGPRFPHINPRSHAPRMPVQINQLFVELVEESLSQFSDFFPGPVSLLAKIVNALGSFSELVGLAFEGGKVFGNGWMLEFQHSQALVFECVLKFVDVDVLGLRHTCQSR